MSDSEYPPERTTPGSFSVPPRHREQGVPAPSNLPELRASDLHARRPRRVVIPVLLFLATCLSTFFVGATDWNPLAYLEDSRLALAQIQQNYLQGLTYMGAVLAILLTHEMGHFVTTLWYRIPSSYPIFIPVPVNAIGTMGAVISMDGMRADRKGMFDLGLSGPVAGLIVALPVLWIGIAQLDLSGPPGPLRFHNPLVGKLMMAYLHPELPADARIGIAQLNPWFMAGWVGMLITGLNMLPISQLDGGHVTYALLGRRAHLLARLFVLGAIAFILIYERYVWSLMLVLVILIGTDHPPTSNDRARLGPLRWLIGLASIAIPIFCFTPMAFDF